MNLLKSEEQDMLASAEKCMYDFAQLMKSDEPVGEGLMLLHQAITHTTGIIAAYRRSMDLVKEKDKSDD